MERLNKLQQQPSSSSPSSSSGQHQQPSKDSRTPYMIAVRSEPKGFDSPSNAAAAPLAHKRGDALFKVATADAPIAPNKQTPRRSSTSGYDNVKPTSQNSALSRAAANRRKTSDPTAAVARTFVVDRDRRPLWEKPENLDYNFAEQVLRPRAEFKI